MVTAEISRRQFFKYVTFTGAALALSNIRTFAGEKAIPVNSAPPDFDYQSRTFRVEHLQEVKEWFIRMKEEKRISSNKTFRSYIDGFIFDPRAYLYDAKSFIIFSVPQQLQSITFNNEGVRYVVLIPTGYSNDGLTGAMLKARIHRDIIKDPAGKLKGRVRLPLKTLAVRSGLAEYGRNNIAYVKDYGSYHALFGLFTDKELEDDWGPMKMMRFCKGCSLCIRECPTRCIRNSEFVIDEGRCLALYSELPDPFPAWIKPGAHNALVGCLKCQYDCPANAAGKSNIMNIAEMTEEETDFILKQGKDKEYYKKIIEKLKAFPVAEDQAYFTRNLKLVLANTKPL